VLTCHGGSPSAPRRSPPARYAEAGALRARPGLMG
jgi:hypothetical protein